MKQQTQPSIKSNAKSEKQKYAKIAKNALKCRKQFNSSFKSSGKIRHSLCRCCHVKRRIPMQYAYIKSQSKAPSEQNFMSNLSALFVQYVIFLMLGVFVAL